MILLGGKSKSGGKDNWMLMALAAVALGPALVNAASDAEKAIKCMLDLIPEINKIDAKHYGNEFHQARENLEECAPRGNKVMLNDKVKATRDYMLYQLRRRAEVVHKVMGKTLAYSNDKRAIFAEMMILGKAVQITVRVDDRRRALSRISEVLSGDPACGTSNELCARVIASTNLAKEPAKEVSFLLPKLEFNLALEPGGLGTCNFWGTPNVDVIQAIDKHLYFFSETSVAGNACTMFLNLSMHCIMKED